MLERGSWGTAFRPVRSKLDLPVIRLKKMGERSKDLECLRMKKDSFLPSKPFFTFSSKSYDTNYTVHIYIVPREGAGNATTTAVQDRSIISSRSRFLRRRDEDRDVLSIWRREGLPSVVCNCRSCEGVTHQEQTVYTSGRVFADTGRDDNINRETSVCLGQRDTR